MADASQSSERIVVPIDARPRVVVVDRDARRLLGVTRAFAARGIVASAHHSTEGFWVAVPKVRPTVLVLEVVPPLMSAVRTIALVTEMLGRAPGLVLYGWVPVPALARIAAQIPGAICLSNDEGPEVLVDAVERAHRELLERGRVSAPPEAVPEPPVAPVRSRRR
jgi:FixJ family two-component response regulator